MHLVTEKNAAWGRICFALSLLLLIATVASAQVAGEAPPMETVSESAQQLIFFAISDPEIVTGENVIQIRIQNGTQPLVFERLTFDFADLEVPETPATQGSSRSKPVALDLSTPALELLAYNPDTLLELHRKHDQGQQLTVEILLNGQELRRGTFAELIEHSAELRKLSFHCVAATSLASDFSRPGFSDAGIQVRNACEDQCYDDHSECEVDYCYWDYNQYMCEQGCDEDLDECLESCIGWVPPTCTPGTVVSSWSTTEFTGSQFLGSSCLKRFFYPFDGSSHYRWKSNYKVTNWERRRNADCTTYNVVASVSYYSTYCFQDIHLPCFGAFAFPGCVF